MGQQNLDEFNLGFMSHDTMLSGKASESQSARSISRRRNWSSFKGTWFISQGSATEATQC